MIFVNASLSIHVVVIDRLFVSPVHPYRDDVMVGDGMSFSSIHPYRAIVLIGDGLS